MKDSKAVIDFKPTKLHERTAVCVKFIIGPLVKREIEPNRFTELSVVAALMAGICIAMGWWWQAIIGLLLNGLCDVIDGELARSLPKRSHRLNQLGVFLDPATDRVNDGLFFLGLLWHSLQQAYQHVQINGLPATYVVFLYKVFCVAIVAAAIAHPISSYYRAKIESMSMRFQEEKPLTRAGFHLCLGLVCFGMWIVPYSYENWFFVSGTLLLIVMPTIFNWFRRLRHSMKLFDER